MRPGLRIRPGLLLCRCEVGATFPEFSERKKIMPSAPASPFRQLYQRAQKLVVLLGPVDGTAPEEDDQVDWLIPQSASITAGSGRDDVLSFAVDLAKLESRLVDTTTPVAYQRQVELRLLDDENKPKTIIGWGFLAKNPQAINDAAESTSFEARLANAHFGIPLTQYPVCDTGDRLDVQRPLVFNPEIDEVICPNMSDVVDADHGWSYVVDPESLRTSASQAYQEQEASSWTLSEAVLALCWWLNPDETYIKNPTKKDVQDAFTARGTLIKNVEIRWGAFLPEALDQLLGPFEYGWHLVHTINDGTRETAIKFFPRGEGIKKQVSLQRPAETRDIKKTTVADFDAVYDLFEMANRIEVYGDYLKREATFQLQKGWPTALDSTHEADLERGQATAEAHPNVGRKWILNEAGDYNGLRMEITEPYSFNTMFGSTQQVRRRRFIRCLSQHADADDLESNGFRVDWYDASQAGAITSATATDPGWVRVKWPFSVLEKECGILFEGASVPEGLWALISNGHHDQALVRITATVVGDKRVKGTATRQARSPNAQDITLVLDLHDRFQFSKVDSSSIFASRTSTARDDSTAIQTYAEKVRDIEDACKIHCSIVLEGIGHPQYAIGDLINNVNGRGLSLNGYNPQGGGSTRNPQIVGFTWHLAGNQRLELMLDSFERERPQILHEKGV